MEYFSINYVIFLYNRFKTFLNWSETICERSLAILQNFLINKDKSYKKWFTPQFLTGSRFRFSNYKNDIIFFTKKTFKYAFN